MLEVRLLGSFQIKYGKKTVELSSRAAQSLFAFLILNAGTSYRREKLAGQLWPESTEESARDYLRHALWRIRKSLQSAASATYLHADDLSISFETSADYWLDAAVLKAVSDQAPAEQLIEALSNYTGELLPGFYDEWVVLEREHLQALYERKMGCLLDALQDGGRWPEVLEWGEKWIALGQKPEAAYRALMRAHAALGDMSKAAAVYERCIAALQAFGMQPSAQTTELYENLKKGKGTSSVRAATRIEASQPEAPTSLPVPLTSFVGREKELAEIAALLKQKRLVTLVGPGGVGKTRLAIQCSKKVSGKFKDGVWWVELAGLSDPSLVSETVGKAIHAHEIPNQPLMKAMVDELRAKQALLVLDNCEHLIAACAQLAERLLSACPELKILATSRESLEVLGEAVWSVPSLTLPGAQELPTLKEINKFESIRLFMDRALSVRPGFELLEQNAKTVVQICQRLDGMPLAIELAAARTRMMSVEELAARLVDRLNLLSAGNRSALPRQQTLLATIDWSYELLSEPERILFRRLSIFTGGFSMEAAETVCSGSNISEGQIDNLIGQLINKSLLIRQTQSDLADVASRYRMLETIREYAHRKLEEAGEAAELRQRHLRYFAALARRVEEGLYSEQQAEWFKRANDDAENFRAALDAPGITGESTDAGHGAIYAEHYAIVSSIAMFWERGYRRETSDALKRILELDRTNEATRARAKALYVGGFLLWSSHNFAEAQIYLQQSMELAERLGDKLILAWSLSYLGWTLDSLGKYDAARGVLQRAVDVAASLGDAGKQAAASAMTFLGDIPYWQGDLPDARKLYEDAIAFTRKFGNKNTLTYPLRRLGYLSAHQGKYMQAAQLLGESLDLNLQLDHRPGIAACVAGYAAIKLAEEEADSAAMLCGFVESQLERFGAPFFYADQVEYERTVAALKDMLGAGQLSSAWAKGRAMSLEQAVKYTAKMRKQGKLTASRS